jgi:guanylate kinase
MDRVEGESLPRNGCLFIVSGPSGAGKTSIAAPVLAAFEDIQMSISLTTRKRRGGEAEGVDYHFVSEADFDARIRNDELAEWAEVHGSRYGTASTQIDTALAAGRDLLLDIDVQGAQQIKKRYPGSVGVFLLPPSRSHLETRLRDRGTDAPATVARRLEAACREIGALSAYDYVIVNEHLPTAVEQFLNIVRTERQKVSRFRAEALAGMIAAFQADP